MSHQIARQGHSVLMGSVNAPMVLGVHNVTALSAQEIVGQRKVEAYATWCVIFLLKPIVVFDWVIEKQNEMFNLNKCICLQTLGLCVCTVGWAGSDCSSISDSDSLVWETLLDTQLSAVRS